MLLHRGQTIAGEGAWFIRELLRTMHPGGRAGWALARRFRMPEPRMEALLSAMQAQGLVVPHPTEPEVWTETPLGARMRAARIGTPIPRDRALTLLDQALQRVRTANAHPDNPLFISRVWLHGSLLADDRTSVGDVNLAYLPRHKGDATEPSIEARCLRFAELHAPHRVRIAQGLRESFAAQWLCMQLRGRTAFVNAIDVGQLDTPEAPRRLLYIGRWDREAQLVRDDIGGDSPEGLAHGWPDRVGESCRQGGPAGS